MTWDHLPTYRELCERNDGHPQGSSWGVWGPKDELGALNLLTNERTLLAVQRVQHGKVFSLGLPLEEPTPQLAWRSKPVHRMLRVGHHLHNNQPGGKDDDADGQFVDRDDVVDGLWLQGGTQWDGLAHIRHPVYGNYNAIPDEEIHPDPGARLGIDRWAARGVVGRAVVADMPGFYSAASIDYDRVGDYEISASDVVSALSRQNTDLRSGDILLIYTGWTEALKTASADQRAIMMDFAVQRSPGLSPTIEMVEMLWNKHVAAVAADNAAVEVMRPNPTFFLHQHLIALLGIPLGEYWDLHSLVADSRQDGRYECLLVSVPLNIAGAIGSPPQAVALK